MKVLIVEDEPLAVAQLSGLILSLRPQYQIIGVCDTVREAVKWINEHPGPDLAFFDIQLGDGLSFRIFEQTEFNVPVIFTTAYNEYAIQAFKVNSIDYLLKPVHREELDKALNKFEQHNSYSATSLKPDVVALLRDSIVGRNYKKRFLVKIGERLRMINTSEISYFYSLDKATFAKTTGGKHYLLDQTLETLEQLIDPEEFYRINRKYLVSLDSIKEVFAYSNSRLKLKVLQSDEDDFLVAREKVKAFKLWLEGDSPQH